MSQDLTKGSIPKHILRMSLPTMSGLLFQALYDIVDMIWIGRISYSAVASVTIFVSLFWLFEVVNSIIGISSVSLISQSFGAGNKERTKKAAEQTLTFKFSVAILAASILWILLIPLLRLFTNDALVIEQAVAYGRPRVLFIPIFFSSFSVNTIFRCTGDAKTPMYLLIGSAILNIILDPVMMFDQIPGTSIPGLGMGLYGAAMATNISFSLSFIIGLVILFKGTKRIKISIRGLFVLDREIDKKLLTIGLPSGMEMLFRNAANSLLIRMVGIYGVAAIALIGVGTRIYSFMMMPLLGILMGSGTIAGQNLGAEQVDRAKSTARYSALLGMVIATVFSLVIVICAEDILGLFLTDLSNMQEGILMMRIVAPSLIVAAFSFGIASSLSGAGHNIPFFYSCIIGKWVIMIPYVAITIYIFQAPLAFIWISFWLSEIAEGIVLYHSYRRGTWIKKRV